nr:leucoanthocyanidin dioxygenase [Tanacetum cinerariifolium]
MVSTLQSWPEPVVRVQSVSDSGTHAIPECYVKAIYDRPSSLDNISSIEANDIPIIDLANLYANDPNLRKTTMDLISDACREWGMFQVINHGVSHHLMEATKTVWREFFHLPLDMKQTRVGVEKGAKLDWSDYFFLHFLPASMRDERKWPTHPSSCRLMKIFSVNLGLDEDYLEKAFGGEEIGASLRVNFYPKCPQPDLTLGISPHSDSGGITILLPDDHVSGLQVRKDDAWVTVKPIPNAFIINIADQLQVLSNAKYKSIEHRVIVNSNEERVSLAFFYNPRGDIPIKPAEELITDTESALYQPMTFNEYRTFIRLNGLHGKSQVESLKSPR